jgi:diguanylate cyclase (GGDEF)-like protein/PAS domain S-box-containing protein
MLLVAKAMEQVGEGVAVYDEADILIYANPAFAAMHGSTPSQIEGMHVSTFVQLTPEIRVQRERDQAAGINGTRHEFTAQLSGGRSKTVQVTVTALRDDQNTKIGQVVCVLDVTERKVLEEQLKAAAWQDSLTGLPNRRLLCDRLDEALEVANRSRRALAVLFLDLDDFKAVNDVHGHDAGDQLLQRVAGRLEECVRAGDTVARLGGDEFVIMLPDPGTDPQLHATADRIMKRVAEPYVLDRVTVGITASIGMALVDMGSARDVLHAADGAMYQAKQAGPGRIVTASGHRPSAGTQENAPGTDHAGGWQVSSSDPAVQPAR